MLKLTDALEELIRQNSWVQVGLQDQVLNLSAVAKYFKPLIDARCKKEVSVSAIHMALSRLQRILTRRKQVRVEQVEFQNITVHSDLSVLSYVNTKETHSQLNQIYTKIHAQNGYMTITEGIHEITIIIDKRYFSTVEKTISQKPKRKSLDVTALAVKFDEKFLEMPGFLYRIIQILAFQGINIIELASTATEIVFYISHSDVRLAFDTLISRTQRAENQELK